MTTTIETLTLSDAVAMTAAATAHAEGLGVEAAIVILASGGDLIAATRMDRAWPGSFDLAMAKARVARSFGAESGYFTPLVQPGAPLFGVGTVEAGKYLTLPGGVPIVLEGTISGAIGVSGGTPDQDLAIARAGAEGLPALPKTAQS